MSTDSAKPSCPSEVFYLYLCYTHSTQMEYTVIAPQYKVRIHSHSVCMLNVSSKKVWNLNAILSWFHIRPLRRDVPLLLFLEIPNWLMVLGGLMVPSRILAGTHIIHLEYTLIHPSTQLE